jgi:hypothetical protein
MNENDRAWLDTCREASITERRCWYCERRLKPGCGTVLPSGLWCKRCAAKVKAHCACGQPIWAERESQCGNCNPPKPKAQCSCGRAIWAEGESRCAWCNDPSPKCACGHPLWLEGDTLCIYCAQLLEREAQQAVLAQIAKVQSQQPTLPPGLPCPRCRRLEYTGDMCLACGFAE